jgi:hypothetical protein
MSLVDKTFLEALVKPSTFEFKVGHDFQRFPKE